MTQAPPPASKPFSPPAFQFEDSEDDLDRLDTDDELSYRRDSVYSCVSLPYFHSFLHIKGWLLPLHRRCRRR